MAHRPCRIALLHYSCPPVIGGVEFMVAAHARLLADAGHHVEVIVGEGDSFDERIPVRRIRQLASIPRERVKKLLKSGEIAGEVRKLGNTLARALADFDVCACHNVLTMHFNPVAANALSRLVQNNRIKGLIAWSHDATLLSSDYAHVHFDDRHWDYLRHRVPNTTYVTISQARRLQISRLLLIPEKDITLVPDGVALKDLLRITDTAERIFLENGLDRCDVFALTPTRIVRRKHLETGIELVDEIRKAGKSVHWLITGAPDRHNPATISYFQHLQQMIADRKLAKEIRFLGASGERVRFATLCSLYRLCDLMLLPSKEEGFGLPLLEAGLAGRLLVVNDIPVLRELAGDYAIYLGGRPTSYTARDVIHYLDNDPPTLMRKNVLKNYTWRSIFKRDIEPLFLRIAGKKNRT